MPTLTPQSQPWPRDGRALLFVHGVGNAKPGDYAPLVEQVRAILGDQARKFACYFLYYDQINDWVGAKLQAAQGITRLVSTIRERVSRDALAPADNGQPAMNSVALANTLAEFAGDVVWPILLADARRGVQAAFLNQLLQIVRDGRSSNIPSRSQHISVICHSLGCFHTYEALHSATSQPAHGLAPATFGVQLDNVIFMASPVALIRTVAEALGAAVPLREELRSLARPPFVIPTEVDVQGAPIPFARHTVSITGDLDPVGGHFFRRRADWAYMELAAGAATHESFVDLQQPLSSNPFDQEELAALFQRALDERRPPAIAAENPHAWGSYIERHADRLRGWLAS